MAPHNDIAAFHEALLKSHRILALCGAGLSASSGLPTFRGAGGLWRNHDATRLATPGAFRSDPGLVWLFYAYRRHMALKARPNPAHYALAELARKRPGFLCLTQNVDGLSPRANHPPEQLRMLHGSLFDLTCFNSTCKHIEHNNMDDPLCPALAPAAEDLADPTATLPLLDPAIPAPEIQPADLPQCPTCKNGLLRPGVVWFGEQLDEDMLDGIDAWVKEGKVDMMFVIGTSAQVWPAAGYIGHARGAGARIVTINPEAEDESEMHKVKPRDFAFGDDAAKLLPILLEPVIGKMQPDGSFVHEAPAA